MPSLKDAIGYLYGLQKSGIKQGLKRIRRLLTLLGNPHREYPSILVAGTNGKGSTAAMLSNILTQAGYRTALYTSPHLLRFNERVRIDGREIGSRELTRLVLELKKIVDENMS
ncbi:MAG TPA: bifunctional folylpolyglutamate synthase/dihydrofolate synthase, partial [Deltaproteobacteria bacterium]|nr:bifunctional folylpolyglutamate synthase/dihydrofolate synthase [Deltaproteobacteria bacterium]